MWTVPGEPAGYQACSVVGTDDSRHDGRPVVGDWADDRVVVGLVIFEDCCVDLDRPHWVRIAKVALHYMNFIYTRDYFDAPMFGFQL